MQQRDCNGEHAERRCSTGGNAHVSLPCNRSVYCCSPRRSVDAASIVVNVAASIRFASAARDRLMLLPIPAAPAGAASPAALLSLRCSAPCWIALLPLLLPAAADNWGEKAKRRRTEGTGRMKYLKDVPRRAKNGFRENTVAPARRVGTSKK